MGEQQYAVEVKFPEAINGYWDGGKRGGGTFTVDGFHSFPPGSGNNPTHPGARHHLRWGCFYLNFFFTCGSGRTWREAASIAKRKLEHICSIAGTTFEIVPHTRGA